MGSSTVNYRITRGRLHERVWKEKMAPLARGFALTSGRMREACEHFKIPQPPLGFWNMSEERRRAERIKPLPVRQDPLEVLDLSPFRRSRPPARSEEEQLALALSRSPRPDKRGRGKFRVPDELVPWLQDMEAEQPADGSGQNVRFLMRRIRMIGSIVDKMKARGFTITAPRGIVFAEQGGIIVSADVRQAPGVGRLHVFCRLNNQPYGERVIQDGLQRSVEQRLPEIVDTLVGIKQAVIDRRERKRLAKIEAEKEAARAAERARVAAIEAARQAQVQREREARERAEAAAADVLVHAIARSEQADKLRRFAALLRKQLPPDDAAIAGQTVAEWMAWIDRRAYALDPLTAGGTALLERIAAARAGN